MCGYNFDSKKFYFRVSVALPQSLKIIFLVSLQSDFESVRLINSNPILFLSGKNLSLFQLHLLFSSRFHCSVCVRLWFLRVFVFDPIFITRSSFVNTGFCFVNLLTYISP